MKYAYLVDVVEYDSWSGPKKLRTMFFWDEQEALDAIKKKHAGRYGPTPEYYINYEFRGRVAVPDLGEIK